MDDGSMDPRGRRAGGLVRACAEWPRTLPADASQVRTSSPDSGMLRSRLRAALALLGCALACALIALPELAAAAPPAMDLPFAKGATWWANGPHSGNGVSGTRNNVDLGPGGSAPATVRAAAAGTAHVGDCSGGHYVTIDHGGGWSTRYWHLGATAAGIDGKHVSAGDVVGTTAIVCDNPTTFSHVHFGLYHDGQPYPLDGVSIGGYTIHAGSVQYSGWWTRNSDGVTVHSTGADGKAACCLVNNQSGSSAEDADADGVPDGSDLCPRTRGAAANHGCPLSTQSRGDVNGDGYSDLVTFKNGTWEARSGHGADRAWLFRGLEFGSASSIPLLGDFNGNGTTDLAVYNGGIWAVREGQHPGHAFILQGVGNGTSTSVPLAGDVELRGGGEDPPAADPPPGTEFQGATIKTRKRQRLDGKRLTVRTRVTAAAKPLEVTVKGRVTISRRNDKDQRPRSAPRANPKHRRYRLTKTTKRVEAGQGKTLVQGLEGSRRKVRSAQRWLKRALRRGRKIQATITIKISDPAGNVMKLGKRVRITRPGQSARRP